MARQFRFPKIRDQRVTRDDYEGADPANRHH
jgi:hypothetical protein